MVAMCRELVALPLLACAAAVGGIAERPKHIVLMLADDLGWDDVGFHGSRQIPTPGIDRLASAGVQLDSYYVQPVCSPTRATLMTGRHVIHTGVYTAFGNDASGDLSLNFTLLPEHLRSQGYATHMVGKWHLGFSNWKQTPLHRGFDTFLGYLGGAQDYWIHGFKEPNAYLDFMDGETPAFEHTCWLDNDCPTEFYSTHLFAKRAIEIIEQAANGSKPLFLYLAWQSVHCVEGPDPEQLKAPQSYIDGFNSTVVQPRRRSFAGMLRALDEGVANVTDALRRTGMYEDTLIIFSTDNGGPADGLDKNMASNWPLRGTKSTLLEGGIRGVGVVSGGVVPATMHGSTLDGLVHVADWFPSLLSLASRSLPTNAHWQRLLNYKPQEPPFELADGEDVLSYLLGEAAQCPRTEVLHEAHADNSIDGIGNALRVGDWKVLMRTGKGWPAKTGSGVTADGWFGGFNSSSTLTDGYALPAGATSQNWTVRCPMPPHNTSLGFACEGATGSKADSAEYACLFNIREDPCEQRDLSSVKPDILTKLLQRLQVFRAMAVKEADATFNPDGRDCPGLINTPDCSGPGAEQPMNCTAKQPCGPLDSANTIILL